MGICHGEYVMGNMSWWINGILTCLNLPMTSSPRFPMIFRPRFARSWQRGSMTRTTCALAADVYLDVSLTRMGYKWTRLGVYIDIVILLYIYIYSEYTII